MNYFDYVDPSGFKRRVFIPDGMEIEDVSEGIPVSLDLMPLFEDFPPERVAVLSNELWDRGLISPSDFTRKEAPDIIRSALLSFVKTDTMDIMALAKERSRDGSNG